MNAREAIQTSSLVLACIILVYTCLTILAGYNEYKKYSWTAQYTREELAACQIVLPSIKRCMDNGLLPNETQFACEQPNAWLVTNLLNKTFNYSRWFV